MKNLLFNIIVLLILGMLVSCGEHDGDLSTEGRRLSDTDLANLPSMAADQDELVFGFDLRSSPQEDARQYLPFLEYLAQSTGYKFKLRFTPQDGKIVDDLGQGVIHLAAIGATSYIAASEKYNVMPLVRGLNLQGKAEYRSMLIVKPNSPFTSVTDLRGSIFAFGSKTSTQGHLIPRIILSLHDMTINDLRSYMYTGSHQQCADAVISNRADACGLQDTMAEILAEQKLVRILFTSSYFPSSGIVANAQLETEVIKNITEALINFDPAGKQRQALYNWERTEMPLGFIRANDSDYEELRNWMHRLNLTLEKMAVKYRLDS